MKSRNTLGGTLCEMVILFAFVCGASAPVGAATFAYVANSNSSTVSVIDTANNSLVTTVPVSVGPFGLAIHPNGGTVYVTHPHEGTASIVSVIDTTTNEVKTTINSGRDSLGVGVHPSGTTFYVTNADDPSVSVFDAESNALVATVPLPIAPPSEGESGPHGIAFHPSGAFAYTANLNDTVSIIDTATNAVVATVGLGNTPGAHCTFFSGTCPHSIVVHPNGQWAYVTRRVTEGHAGAFEPGVVSIIDTETKLESGVIFVENSPAGIAMHPANGFLYVANNFSNTVSVIDTATNTVTTTVEVGDGPLDVAIHPSGDLVYVTNNRNSNVSIIETATNTMIGTFPTGAGPAGIAVGSPSSIQVVEIDIKPGSFPNSINLSAAGVIPVAILSSAAFDAPAEVNPDTLTLAGARVRVAGKRGQTLCHDEEVNNDGLLDLVCQFENELNAEPGDSIAVLEGETFGGTPIRGEDSIRIVPE